MTERGALSHKETIISTTQVDLKQNTTTKNKIQQNIKLKKKKSGETSCEWALVSSWCFGNSTNRQNVENRFS